MTVARLTWACQKYFQILNLEYVNSELSYDTDFCTCRGIHRNSELIQLLQAV